MPITAMRNSLARLSARLAAAMMLLAAPEPVPAPASRPARPLRQSVLSDALAPAQHSMRAQFWAQNGDQNQAHTPDPRVLTPSSRTARLSNPLSIYFPRSSAGARRRQIGAWLTRTTNVWESIAEIAISNRDSNLGDPTAAPPRVWGCMIDPKAYIDATLDAKWRLSYMRNGPLLIQNS